MGIPRISRWCELQHRPLAPLRAPDSFDAREARWSHFPSLDQAARGARSTSSGPTAIRPGAPGVDAGQVPRDCFKELDTLMPTLSTADTAKIQSLITYLERGAAGKTIDDTTANALARIFGSSCGFKCGCPGTFLEWLRDAPYATLLRALICPGGVASSAGPVNPLAGAGAGAPSGVGNIAILG